MSAYLFTFRAPADYAPSADTFNAWATWQHELGARLKDRGAIEVCELANHDDRFDNWLDTIGDLS